MIRLLLHTESSPDKNTLMTFKKVLLILAFLTASEFIFTGCSDSVNRSFDPQTEQDTEQKSKKTILISEYDHIMKSAAREGGLDWRFIAAIGYQESRFMNDVVSPVGAIGIMQVMPAVARAFGVSADSVAVAQTNIETAVKVLKSIESSLQFSPQTSEEDRLKVILACYNGGIGHVVDARRLAAKYGANYNRWDDLVKYLKIKGSPEHVGDEVVRCGAFNWQETVSFVDVVMRQYEKYRSTYPAA